MDESAGFFGHFLAPFLEKIRERSTDIRMVTLSEFLKSGGSAKCLALVFG